MLHIKQWGYELKSSDLWDLWKTEKRLRKLITYYEETLKLQRISFCCTWLLFCEWIKGRQRRNSFICRLIMIKVSNSGQKPIAKANFFFRIKKRSEANALCLKANTLNSKAMSLRFRFFFAIKRIRNANWTPWVDH